MSCREDRSSESGSARLGGSLVSQRRSVSSSKRSRPLHVPVGFPRQRNRELECKLCTCTAGSGNPLRFADREPQEHGGCRPWAKYINSAMDGEVVRVPVGRLCLLCLNCYRQLGYHHKYGSLSKYLTHIAMNPAEHIETFHRSLRLYIEKLQDAPEKFSLRQRRELLDAQITIDDKLRRGTTQLKAWTFIEKEYWDETSRGALPKEKLCEQVVNGEKKLGIMVVAEPPGHHRFEAFETKEMVESEQVCDTQQGAFPEEALMNAKDTLSKVHEQECCFRSQHLVSDVPKPAPVTAEQLDQVTGLLRSLGHSPSAPTAAIVSKDDDTTELWIAPRDHSSGEEPMGEEASLASTQGEDEDKDSDLETALDLAWDERRTRLQMASSFVPPKVAGKAPGNQGPAGIAGKEAARKRPLSAGSEPPSKRAGMAPATQSESSSVATREYDRRIMKRLNSYDEALDKAQLALDAVSFDEGLDASKSDFIEAIKSRHKAINEVKEHIKGLETKIRRAKGLPFQQARSKFIELQTRCTMFSAFNTPETLALSPSPPTPLLHSRAAPCKRDQGKPEGS